MKQGNSGERKYAIALRAISIECETFSTTRIRIHLSRNAPKNLRGGQSLRDSRKHSHGFTKKQTLLILCSFWINAMP
jgi:hypothetical protein